MLLLRLPLLRLTTHPKKGRSLDPPGRSAVHSWPMPSAYCSSMTAHLWPPPPTALIEEGKLKPQPRNAICETETAAYWRCRWLLNTPQCHAKGEQESTSRTFLKRIAWHLVSPQQPHHSKYNRIRDTWLYSSYRKHHYPRDNEYHKIL